MPPFLLAALGAIGAAALTKFLAAENRRINETLDKQRPDDAAAPEPTPLERDPATGAYRPRVARADEPQA